MRTILDVTNAKWFDRYYRAMIARGDIEVSKVGREYRIILNPEDYQDKKEQEEVS